MITISVLQILGFFQHIPILFDEYKESTTAFVTTTFATLPWILFGVTGQLTFATLAVLLHIVPPVVYYKAYGPFGIHIDYTPTKFSEVGQEPDKISERKGEAVLTDGRGTLFLNVEVSKRMNEFSMKFSTPEEISVELRDIPRKEQDYDRAANVLSCDNITQREFSMVLEIFVQNQADRRREYPFEIIDEQSGKAIIDITLIDS